MFLQRGSAILRAPDPDPAGGGGGDPKDPPANPFSDEQQIALGQLVNQAVTSQMKRGLAPAIAEAMKGINWGETLAPEFAKLAPVKTEPDPDPKGGGTKSDLERQLAKIAGELEAEKSARTAADKLRLQVEHDRKVDAATVKLRAALQDKVAPGALEHALAHLTQVQKRLSVDENGKELFTVRKAAYKGGPENDEQVTLEEALPIVLAEDSMKIFLPAPKGQPGNNPGPRGNGALPQYSSPASTEEERSRRVIEATAALAAKHNIT
jgi:hypothetical protein